MRTAPTSMRSARLATTSPELDAAEAEWWNRFSPVNERLWGLDDTTAIALRASYLDRAARFLADSGAERVLDLGCGSGFVSGYLAERGFTVLGLDVSEEQIRLARESARDRGLGDRLSFEVAGIERLRERGERFDGIVTHAFLHHLAADELNELLGDMRALVALGGAAWFLEPVFFPPGGLTGAAWAKRVERYGSYLLKRAVSGRGLIDEQPLRAAEDFYAEAERNGYFLSPKEVPFTAREFVDTLGAHFRVERAQWTMAGSYATAQWVTLLRDPKLRERLARTTVAAQARFDAWLGDRGALGLYRGLDGYGFAAAYCRLPAA